MPAVIILSATGHVVNAIGLAVFCALVVGSLDNFLRPILVGRDTQMHELLIFLETLGGIIMFGVVGFIIGPIIAALFVTVRDIYCEAFKDGLPSVTISGAYTERKTLSLTYLPTKSILKIRSRNNQSCKLSVYEIKLQ